MKKMLVLGFMICITFSCNNNAEKNSDSTQDSVVLDKSPDTASNVVKVDTLKMKRVSNVNKKTPNKKTQTKKKPVRKTRSKKKSAAKVTT